MKKTILILLSLLIISCSTNDKDEYQNDQSLYENNNLNDYQLFNLANEFISSNQLDLALIELDKLEELSAIEIANCILENPIHRGINFLSEIKRKEKDQEEDL